ncbi:Gfo/Idh/MocA family protein [Aureibacillus halotolerans]|uniref:Putative dehydrogenase n=1 Tax=Aureibacillus halotolerans TaxID=1508390 RepID=A0A4R6TZJ9_9BACI|nr:Gfo/Idh/MocA family oxidoreductase [Aureibacillus halotolerans]TDQ38312.1 putative dehydrogenase [Aureibacillus halotolerans]
MGIKEGKVLPKKQAKRVVEQGEFVFAAVGLAHGHIQGMCNGLIAAGAELKYVYDEDEQKVAAFCEKFPNVRVAETLEQILSDEDIKLVAGAAIPSERCALGVEVMEAGKDYFTAKTPFTTLEQLEIARAKVKETGQKYIVHYSERTTNESAIYAGQLIEEGAIGRVLQVIGFGPHRLSPSARDDWFFQKEKYGGILCDIGSHQADQFLHYTGATDATVTTSRVANYNHPQYPELEDFGEASLLGNNGATNYYRIDWFTPDGLSSWGDSRIFLLGTEGSMELRKNIDIGRATHGSHLYLANHEGETYYDCFGKVGRPFFGELILDCLNRTENAMTQEHAFKATELSLKAQSQAVVVEGL